jgi:iron complex transport system substrate-binding protein
MRIVSLLPAATEWVCAFGAAEDLVGRSHECDYPADIQDVPVVTRATYSSEGDSAAIDTAVQEKLQNGLSLYAVDLDRLRELEPDVILTQDQCDVCAVSMPELEEALRDGFGSEPEVFSMQPSTFKQVLDAALRLGRLLDRTDAAMSTVAALERRLQQLRDRLGVDKRDDPADRTTIACIEWMEPLMTAGHWMPDVAGHAGARAVLSAAGSPSQPVAWSALRQTDPDVLAVMPCGFTLDETRRDLSYLTRRDGWNDLTAVRDGRVALLDGNAYFNRPGPRLYRSTELLASVVAPHRADLDPPARDWERQWWKPTASTPQDATTA